jgi:hypothetical protein
MLLREKEHGNLRTRRGQRPQLVVVGVVDGGASVVVVIVVVVGSLVVGGGRNVLGAIRLGNTSTIGTKRCLRMGCCSGKK